MKKENLNNCDINDITYDWFTNYVLASISSKEKDDEMLQNFISKKNKVALKEVFDYLVNSGFHSEIVEASMPYIAELFSCWAAEIDNETKSNL